MQEVTKSYSQFDKYDKMGAYHWIECDRSSPRYNPPLEARYQVVLRRVGDAQRVLDIGCGDGYLINLLRPLAKQIIGVDSEFSGIALAKEKLAHFDGIQIAQASCYELPFQDKYFDLILLNDVIEHLEQPSKCLSEIRRVLAPEGTLLMTTPKWRPDRMWDTLHIQEFKPEELQRLLEPFFSKVNLNFFWPLWWSKRYATKIGWRLIRIFCRYFYNPFLAESDQPEKCGQILAVCNSSQ